MKQAWTQILFAILLPLSAVHADGLTPTTPSAVSLLPGVEAARIRQAGRLCAFRFEARRMRALRQEGDEEQWLDEWLVQDPPSPEQVFAAFQDTIRQHATWLESTPRWTRIDEGDEPLRSQWRFHDEQDQTWRGVLEVTPQPGSGDGVLVVLRLHLDPPRASI